VILKPMRVFFLVEAILAVGYFAMPPSPAKAACYTALGLGVVAAIVVGVRTQRPRQPQAWYLLAAGQLLFTSGDTINSAYEWVLQSEAPFPSSADAVYIACYVFLGGGLLLLARAQTPGRDRTSLIDAVIIATVPACSAGSS
jgi:hypothetical protein